MKRLMPVLRFQTDKMRAPVFIIHKHNTNSLTVYPVNGEHLQNGEYEDDKAAAVIVDQGEDELTTLFVIFVVSRNSAW